jgi:nucleotide-binding universal stress UspA family protein
MDDRPVIAGTDGSQVSLRAVQWAAREAASRRRPLRIVSVPALPPRMFWQEADLGPPDTVAHTIRKASQQALASAAALAAAQQPGLAVDTALLTGPPALVLAQAGSGASMLVLGSRGEGGFAALLLGSVSRYAAMHAPCPVAVIRGQSTAEHGEIVVGVKDLDQPAAINFGFEEAKLRAASLRVLYAWHWFLPTMRLTGTERPGADAGQVTSEAAGWLAGLLEPWRQMYQGVKVTAEVVHAKPGHVLAEASARADLVVLGRNSDQDAPGPGAGAVTHAVLNHARCPVIVIPE